MSRACKKHGRGEKRTVCRVSVEKPEGKRLLVRCRSRWKDNMKTDAKEIGWESADLIHLSQDKDQWQAVVSTAITFELYTRSSGKK
jgi:hypothetical protein